MGGTLKSDKCIAFIFARGDLKVCHVKILRPSQECL